MTVWETGIENFSFHLKIHLCSRVYTINVYMPQVCEWFGESPDNCVDSCPGEPYLPREFDKDISTCSEGMLQHACESATKADEHKIFLYMRVLDLVMISPIQIQCIFSYTVLVNPRLEPCALHDLTK